MADLLEKRLHRRRRWFSEMKTTVLCHQCGPCLAKVPLGTEVGMEPQPIKRPGRLGVLPFTPPKAASPKELVPVVKQIGLVGHIAWQTGRLAGFKLDATRVHFTKEVTSKAFNVITEFLGRIDGYRCRTLPHAANDRWKTDGVAVVKGRHDGT